MEEQHHINDKPAIMCLSKDMILLIASLLDEQDLANWAHSCRPFYQRLYDYRVAKLKRHCTITVINAGAAHSLFARHHTLYASGRNDYGQLGLGDTKERRRFGRVKGLLSPVIKLAAGYCHTQVLLKNGELWACGGNDYGQLGLGDTQKRQRFERIKELPSPIIKLAAGNYHSLVILKNGELWACGLNTQGQLGLRSKSKDRFVKITSSKIPAMMQLFTNNLRTINYAALNHLLEHTLSLLAIEHSPHQKTLLVKKLLADCQRCDWRLIDDSLRQDVDQLTPDNLKDFYKKCRRLLNEETSQASTHDKNRVMRK